MDKLFGTDGIRGRVGVYPLTEDMVYTIGRAAGFFVEKADAYKRKAKRISIAKDTRTSGDMFELQLIKGITSCGVDVVRLGVTTTPSAAFLARKLNHDMSIVVSASHNGIDDNGLKFFSHKGYKLSLREEQEIEQIINTLQQPNPDVTENLQAEKSTGNICEPDQPISSYIIFLKELVSGLDLSGYQIAADCAFGSISYIIPEVAKTLGINIVCINNAPSGENINSLCGSLHPDVVSEYVVRNNLDCGFAFDGDGDRVILCDEKGQVLDGDFILAIISRYLSQRGLLNRNSIAATHMSNIGFEIAVSQWGGKVVKTEVGDKYVLDKMLRSKLNLGGEQSGHILLLDYSTTGDGLLAALFVLKIMAEENKPLSSLGRCMYKFPQMLLNIDVAEKRPIESLTKTKKAIEKGEKRLGSSGRLYVRYSGTENKLRVMVEGQNNSEIREIAEDIASAAKEEINAKIRC
jgi:phosphoglucosamine mutase